MELSIALRSNAVFTAACALICLVATDFVTVHTMVAEPFWIMGLGVMLLAFVPMLLFAAARPLPWLVRIIIILDWGYVALALSYYLLSWWKVDGVGAALILVPPAFVALFAWLQRSELTVLSEKVDL